MTRKEFLEKSIVLSIGLPFLSTGLLQACSKSTFEIPNFSTDYKGKIIIIGAGASGLMAGYLLKQYQVDFEILEAGSNFGGRLKKLEDFADFPIDLGAEWIHIAPEIFSRLTRNENTSGLIETIEYNPQTIKTWKNNKLKSHNYIKGLYSEWKFKASTWFDFFENYIVPEIHDSIRFNTVVEAIDYSNGVVQISTNQNKSYEGDKVLITSSIRTLQNQQIEFTPVLPESKVQAINNVFMGDGIKIFVEFNERFYPDILSFGNIFKALREEEKFVYDAAFKKDSSKHILGLFAINSKAKAYTKLETDEAIINLFLSELDEMFDGKASQHYLQHHIQNWSNEPYIQGAYSYSFTEKQQTVVDQLKAPVNERLYFAGEALSVEYQAMVHGACESAYNAVGAMINASLEF